MILPPPRPDRFQPSRRTEVHVAQIDIEILSPFTARYLKGSTLTPAERVEVLRIAQGYACKDSAAAAGVSPETIRARRKRIYRKTQVAGSGVLIASMLGMSLDMLARGEALEPRAEAPAVSLVPPAVATT
jgi:DNA-binding CsgD family transcriptional regulator